MLTVRQGITYVNDRALAVQFLDELRKDLLPLVQTSDEITQRMAVVEAGMRVQKTLGGSFSTPLAEAICALRKLNSVVSVAKHVDTAEEPTPSTDPLAELAAAEEVARRLVEEEKAVKAAAEQTAADEVARKEAEVEKAANTVASKAAVAFACVSLILSATPDV